ncbi:MAG: SemiSWEET transporter [Alphaproteobacteria bacterium]
MLDAIHPDLIGGVAAVLTTIAFVPQVVKSWQTRSTRDISLGMFVIFGTGLSLWLVYGFIIESRPIIVANVVTLMLVAAMIAMKLRGGRG